MDVKHLMTRAAVVGALAATAVMGTTIAASATTPPVGVVKAATQRMAGPTLKTTQYGTYAAGTRVALVCASHGQAVRGYFSFAVGWDDLWYKTPDNGWVADVDIATGSNSAVTPFCGAPTAPVASAPASTTKAQRAVAWANSQNGSNAYVFACQRFVENAFGTSGRFASAIEMFNNLKAAGQMHYNTTGIPAGALVFSSNPKLDLGNGHVMLARGDGTFISGGANGPSVKPFSTPNPGSTFLGWAYAPASWPGR